MCKLQDQSSMSNVAVSLSDSEEVVEGDERTLKNEGFSELVMKILAQMCDGQNQALQDYIRIQPDNIKSINIIGELALFVSSIYTNIDQSNIELVIELFNTLNECTSGNQANRKEVLSLKMIDIINVILRTGEYPDCEEEQVR